jgi:hypothetical protein
MTRQEFLQDLLDAPSWHDAAAAPAMPAELIRKGHDRAPVVSSAINAFAASHAGSHISSGSPIARKS